MAKTEVAWCTSYWDRCYEWNDYGWALAKAGAMCCEGAGVVQPIMLI